MKDYKKIEEYIFEFLKTRFDDFNSFFYSVNQTRRTGIYMLSHGTSIMDFLISIHGILEDKLFFKNLIPQKFADPDSLFEYLNGFKKYLNDNQFLIDANLKDENTDYAISELYSLKNELVKMIDYTKLMYDYEDTVVPYQELRFNLITRNIPDFIKILNSVLASVSFEISMRVHEGYFHSNVHLILKLLGFNIVSEDSTSNGRIDAVIRFTDIIYIMEFKFSNDEDLSTEALNQIKIKGYADKFIMEKKLIIGIGISFSRKSRSINNFISEELI